MKRKIEEGDIDEAAKKTKTSRKKGDEKKDGVVSSFPCCLFVRLLLWSFRRFSPRRHSDVFHSFVCGLLLFRLSCDLIFSFCPR